MNRAQCQAIADFIRQRAEATSVDVAATSRRAGAEVDGQWLLQVAVRGGPLDGDQSFCLKPVTQSTFPQSLTITQEFAVARAAFGAGVPMPEPLWLSELPRGAMEPFWISRWVPGSAEPHHLIRELSEEQGDALAFRLGQELARLHKISFDDNVLSVLPSPSNDWVVRRMEALRQDLDQIPPRPVFELAINWLIDHVPKIERLTLVHGSFRIDNVLVDDGQPTEITNFGLAGWSDPMEDLGWFCARCWRHGVVVREAGGIGSRDTFYDGYRDVAGNVIEPDRVRYWESYATLRWGIVAAVAAERFIERGGGDLKLAMTGLRSVEAEYDLVVEMVRSLEGVS